MKKIVNLTIISLIAALIFIGCPNPSNPAVEDKEAPVITLTGAAIINLTVGDAYVELGATATDNKDSNLTVLIDSSSVNTASIGTYYVTYNVSDSAGNAATEVRRTVNVVGSGSDTEAPVISLIGSSTINLTVGDSYVELGANVSDNVDVGLVAVIDSSAVNTDVVGSYSVTYNAQDAAGNSADQVTRTVNVNDPVTNLIVNGDFATNDNTGWTTSGGAGSFNYISGECDATISSTQSNSWDIQLFQTVSLDTETYLFSFDYSSTIDSDIYVSIENPAYTSFLSTGGDNKPLLQATSTVKTFSNTFTMSAAEATSKVVFLLGKAESGAVITIDNVLLRPLTEEEIGPVISITGDNPYSIIEGDDYIDEGATALDNQDGDVTSSIIVGGDTINSSSTVGTYYVTYSATDSDGNTTVATRTVNVNEGIVDPTVDAPTPGDLSAATVFYSNSKAADANVSTFAQPWDSRFTFDEVVIDSNDTLRYITYAHGGAAGIAFDSIDVSGHTMVHFDFYAVGDINQVTLQFVGGTVAVEPVLISTKGAWFSVDLDLSSLGGATPDWSALTQMGLTFYGPGSIDDPTTRLYVDNIYFY